ncbi:LysR substrate-binding domain-containing protein [uncultured Cohaesibacter sp.]|uniref:LysR substrate-binding domain-containing protein n=1 Tax=uncultured Cohaesibacter sp. TaxID=1002546 RepID=UPI00293134EE|nr:LysR substrate-binding domain-containing protein [uncultured Cohaesibacter sp.]
MHLRYIKFFMAVAETKSFTQAAQKMNTAQPSLSRQIRKLEEIVGTPLVIRNTHDVRLTDAGEVFYEESRGILDQVNRAIAAAQNVASEKASSTTIGFVSGTEAPFLIDIFSDIVERCKNLHISFRGQRERHLLESLYNGDVDAAVLAGPITDPDLLSQVIVSQPLIAAIPARHAMAEQEVVSFSQLLTLPFVAPDPEFAPNYHATIQSFARRQKITFLPTQTACDSILMRLQLVGSGVGFALITKYQERFLPDTVVTRPLDLDTTFDLVLAWRKDNQSKALWEVIENMQTSLLDGEIEMTMRERSHYPQDLSNFEMGHPLKTHRMPFPRAD